MVLKWFNRLHVLNKVRWDQDTSSIAVLKNVDHFEWTVYTKIWPQMAEKWPIIAKK